MTTTRKTTQHASTRANESKKSAETGKKASQSSTAKSTRSTSTRSKSANENDSKMGTKRGPGRPRKS